MRSVLYLLTTNPRKAKEWQANFDRYGIEVERRDPTLDAGEIERLLRSGAPDVLRVVAVCREESDLYRRGTRERSARLDLELVDNVTDVTVWFLEEGALASATYSHVTEGFIDRASGATEGEGGWWDTVFRLSSTLLTYEEMQRRGFKNSSRDMAISRFILDRVYYKNPVDLRWNKQGHARTIDFERPVAAFVKSHELLRNPWAVRYGLTHAFDAVVDAGVFFRSAKNRREKIYWWPGLNAGIPFTPKGDEIHECTYMVHDFCHFLVPDLIPVSSGGASPSRPVYVAYRMLGEAITLVLADMVFVDSLVRSGVEYDWTKRRIHPLYVATGLDLASVADDRPELVRRLRELLEANVAYCLRGDDRIYRALLARNGKGTETLERFEEKYAAFFVEDFRWTVRNHENVSARADELARWWTLVEPLRKVGGLDLETVDEFGTRVAPSPTLPRSAGEGDLVARVFDRIFEERIRPALEGRTGPASPEVQRARAFLRYAMGQCAIFARYDFVPETAVYRDRIIGLLLARGLSITSEEIARVRAFYEQYVDLLARKNLVTLDDAATYKEVFPLFEPFYVFYDAAPESYESLAQVAARCLSTERRS